MSNLKKLHIPLIIIQSLYFYKKFLTIKRAFIKNPILINKLTNANVSAIIFICGLCGSAAGYNSLQRREVREDLLDKKIKF